jgi:signal transduction histidine kinase
LFCRRAKARERILKNPEIVTEHLPVAKSPIEDDYINIIKIMREKSIDNLSKWQNERNDSIDYYTTWVHQIKTPIAVMQMILQGEDTEEHRMLSAELFRIEQYVEMVLCYFRLDSSSSDFVFKEYNLDDIIKKAVRKYAPQFIRKRILLKYEPVSLSILTDEKWLLFIIEQILSNAIKYTKTGYVEIRVTEKMVLEISDTGIGIAAEDIPRIFEKGFTGYNGHENTKSTGLGLYLCRQASKKLMHSITVKSEVGKGSTFMIDLYKEKLQTE